MKKIFQNVKVNTTGTINTKIHIFLVYAEDIDIVGRDERYVTAAFSEIEKESAKIVIIVNEEKTKMMLAIASKTPRSKKGEIVTAENRNIKLVKDCVYLGSAINESALK